MLRRISLVIAGVQAMLLAGTAHAACTAEDTCKVVQLKVTSCHAFSVKDDPWLDNHLVWLAKTNPAEAKRLRALYAGVVVEASVEGAGPGGDCTGQGLVVWATMDNPNPLSWFAQGRTCNDFVVDSTVNADAPASCCPGGNNLPCLFLNRPQEMPVLPDTHHASAK